MYFCTKKRRMSHRIKPFGFIYSTVTPNLIPVHFSGPEPNIYFKRAMFMSKDNPITALKYEFSYLVYEKH